MEASSIRQCHLQTIPQRFRERVAESADASAYHCFDVETSSWTSLNWHHVSRLVDDYARAINRVGLEPGARVAILLANGPDWVAFDLAAMSCGLVTVPLYLQDSAENWATIISKAGCRLVLVETDGHWTELARATPKNTGMLVVWIRQPLTSATASTNSSTTVSIERLASAVAAGRGVELPIDRARPDDLATIIYTSGTTASPKGVMLSHHAILWNAAAVTRFIAIEPDDVFLSVLPLAHAFERTLGCYLPMMAGASVAYARAPQTLPEDFKTVRPTVFLGVPRIYERIAARIRRKTGVSTAYRWVLETAASIGWARFQAERGRGPRPSILDRLAHRLLDWFVAGRVRAALGGRLRVAVSGGAPLPPDVSYFLCGMGVPLVEGYGLTEAAPVVTATTIEDSLPGSVGRPLHGVDVRLGENDELFVKTPARMIGYWQDARATNEALDDGWLRTGDTARIDNGRVFITGRLKDLVVLSTGEKVSASAVEAAVSADPLFAQVCVLGNGRPCLVAVVIPETEAWERFAIEHNVDAALPGDEAARRIVLARINGTTTHLAVSAQIRAVVIDAETWAPENGLLTPTLKVRRNAVAKRYAGEIEDLYRALDATNREGAAQ
jgi:long-chain acyl-CoA synthetase